MTRKGTDDVFWTCTHRRELHTCQNVPNVDVHSVCGGQGHGSLRRCLECRRWVSDAPSRSRIANSIVAHVKDSHVRQEPTKGMGAKDCEQGVDMARHGLRT
jgi:hypothetical protein